MYAVTYGPFKGGPAENACLRVGENKGVINFIKHFFFCFQFSRRKNASFKNHISTTKFPLSANKLIWTISLQLNQYHILTCIKQYPTPETNMPLTEKSGTQFNAKFLFFLIQETTKLKDAR